HHQHARSAGTYAHARAIAAVGRRQFVRGVPLLPFGGAPVADDAPIPDAYAAGLARRSGSAGAARLDRPPGGCPNNSVCGEVVEAPKKWAPLRRKLLRGGAGPPALGFADAPRRSRA